MRMNSTDRFAAEVRRFRTWFYCGTHKKERAVREALRHVTRLVAAALDLPPVCWDKLHAEPAVAGGVLKVADFCRFESGGFGGWILFEKDSFSCLFSYSRFGVGVKLEKILPEGENRSIRADAYSGASLLHMP